MGVCDMNSAVIDTECIERMQGDFALVPYLHTCAQFPVLDSNVGLGFSCKVLQLASGVSE
jgi:hypothetical protein